ncbi:MAG: D-alanyl-D-alanine carboxypeptidase [Clostridia bacterium]|nr:D-alanyl-D-alanine carboxypeptidase [Clostridia bacterium]
MKRFLCVILSIAAMLSLAAVVNATEEIQPFDVSAKSAVLMEANTGRILYAKNPDEPLPPASVTKIMTLLLVMEEIDSGSLSMEDTVAVSEYAASMGGSQVFLEAGEEMSVEDMLKSTVISSANDAAVALSEAVCGSEESFVQRMNERAAELGMENTNFENVTGLDDDTVNHTISAADIAKVSRELIINHPSILAYSSTWMDSIRNGEFGLTNTNRLIRFYKGATGLKTGSTSKAGFCISATAEREGMHLIAVIMGSETRDERNNAAKKLLDYGFASYTMYSREAEKGETLHVAKGVVNEVETVIEPISILIDKKNSEQIETVTEYMENISAPVKEGDVVGNAYFTVNGERIGEAEIKAAATVESLRFADIFMRLLMCWLLK